VYFDKTIRLQNTVTEIRTQNPLPQPNPNQRNTTVKKSPFQTEYSYNDFRKWNHIRTSAYNPI